MPETAFGEDRSDSETVDVSQCGSVVAMGDGDEQGLQCVQFGHI